MTSAAGRAAAACGGRFRSRALYDGVRARRALRGRAREGASPLVRPPPRLGPATGRAAGGPWGRLGLLWRLRVCRSQCSVLDCVGCMGGLVIRTRRGRVQAYAQARAHAGNGRGFGTRCRDQGWLQWARHGSGREYSVQLVSAGGVCVTGTSSGGFADVGDGPGFVGRRCGLRRGGRAYVPLLVWGPLAGSMAALPSSWTLARGWD